METRVVHGPEQEFVPAGIHRFFRNRSRNGTFFLVDQMAEWHGASASGSVDLGFDSESGQTNDFQIGIHSFPA